VTLRIREKLWFTMLGAQQGSHLLSQMSSFGRPVCDLVQWDCSKLFPQDGPGDPTGVVPAASPQAGILGGPSPVSGQSVLAPPLLQLLES
jgi:hypothetical protein